MDHRSAHRAGFTFVEMMMVMVLLGLVLVIAAPRLTVLRARSNMLSAEQHVAAAITAARQTAISRGVPVKFVLAGNAVFSVASPYGAADTVQRALDVEESYGTTLGGDDFEIVFDPRGLATGLDVKKTVVVTYGDRVDSICVQKLGRVQMRNC